MSRLAFAHVTDIHLDETADGWATRDSLAERLTARAIDGLNARADLDFVLITGDVLDLATEAEVSRFETLIGGLEKPWHFIPGNHDGFYDPSVPDALPPHEAVARIDPRMAQPEPVPQHARWSRTLADGVQLVGLESRIADDWAGVINAEQMRWLHAELDACRADSLVIVAVHHPLHHLTPLNNKEPWSNFVCSNGAEVEALLDGYSNVKLVISGHHHASQIVQRANGRMHITTAPLTRYPCVWREIELNDEGGGWHARVEMHSPADAGERKLAYDLLLSGKTAQKYNPRNPDAWAEFVEGRPEDQNFETALEQ